MQNYKFPSNIRLYPRPGLTILTAMNLCFDALSPYPERTGSVVTCIKENKLGRLYASKLISYVGVRRLELPTSTSRTWRAANCATPRTIKNACNVASFCDHKGKHFPNIHQKNFHRTAYFCVPSDFFANFAYRQRLITACKPLHESLRHDLSQHHHRFRFHRRRRYDL